jgi:hypothetical protein
MKGKRYRVVQWGTGNIGTRSLRAVIEHPRLTLVGLYVHSTEKVGRDAGELCGVGLVGVIATQKIDDIIALKPDCVLYMQQGFNLDDVCRLLASGANIVTTRAEFHNPAKMDPVIRERVEEACRRGGTTIHSTGSSPGFITEVVPLVLTLLQRRLDCLTIDEFADLTSRNSPDLLFRVMGFGELPGAPLNHEQELSFQSLQHSLSLIADAISLPLDTFEIKREFAVARKTTRIAAGIIETGKVAAMRTSMTGLRDGRPLFRVRLTWYCTADIEPAWDLRETGWRILVEGDAPLDISILFPVSPDQWAVTSPGLTAHPAVNAVPTVCEAPPGIRSTLDLPRVIATFG